MCAGSVQLTLNVPCAKSETEIIDKVLGSLSDAAEGDNARQQAHRVDCSATVMLTVVGLV